MKLLYKKAALLLIVLLITNVSFSQNEKKVSEKPTQAQKKKIEKAKQDFEVYSFIDAREIYLKVIEDGYHSAQIYKKLGDTYYYNSEYKAASKWYSSLINEYPEEVEAEYYLRAAQSLKSLDKYEESDKMMEKYVTYAGSSLVAKNYTENRNYLETIGEDARSFNIELTTINTEYSDFGPSYYMDNKVVFASMNEEEVEGNKTLGWHGLPFLDLFMADVDEDGNLSNRSLLEGDVNTKFNESSTTSTKDGKTLYFTRNNFTEGKKGRDKDKTIKLKLYKATKGEGGVWSNVEELPFNSDKYSTAHPALSLDEKRLYFASDMEVEGAQGMSDLYYVDIKDDNTFGEPVNLGDKINTDARDSFPFISNANKLYFSTDGRAGLGGLDVFVVSLNEDGSIAEDITNDDGSVTKYITNIGEPANSSNDDFGFIINEETKIGYISSNRKGDAGSIDDEIYLIKECEIILTGLVTDIDSGKLLPGTAVTLLADDNTLLDSTIVGADARYTFIVDCDTQYVVRGIKEKYDPKEELVRTPKKTGKKEVPLRLKLTDPCENNDLGCQLELLPIYFDFDRFNIRPDAEKELAKILAALELYDWLVIHIESHTDSRGNDAYNELLSDKRAKSTLNWLVDQGIDRERLSAKGYGETQHINQCANGVECTEEEHQLNRRSMFIIQN